LALDRIERLTLSPGRFTPDENSPVPNEMESWWASQPVWTLWSREKSLALVEDLTLDVHTVARPYTD
jgi:hypothetical protein